MKKLLNTVRRYITGLSKKGDRARDNVIKLPIETKPDLYFETPVRRYTKSELAELYKRPANTLMRWIYANDNLMRELNQTGYNRFQKEFKKEQVRIIFKHLGEP